MMLAGLSGSLPEIYSVRASRAAVRGEAPQAGADSGGGLASGPAKPGTLGQVREPGQTESQSKAQSQAQSKAEQAQIRQLQQRDRVVRQHEAAHLAASGGLAASGATYSFQRGPDGVAYAVGGEVRINMSPGRTPQETIARAQTIVAAALAPADPSPQDRAVAAQARQMELQARAEQARQPDAQSESARMRQSAKVGRYLEVAGIGEQSSSDEASHRATRIDITA
jgi:hypothetical protein